MAKKKKSSQKVRIEFRKKHDNRSRKNDLTRDYDISIDAMADVEQNERVSGKGKLTRKRTVMAEVSHHQIQGQNLELGVDRQNCLPGRVIQIFGLTVIVLTETGDHYRCTLRGVLKAIASDLQNIVVVGDRVTVQPSTQVDTNEPSDLSSDERSIISSLPTGGPSNSGGEQYVGVIVRIEPRFNEISRTSRQRKQIIAANLDQAIIVTSAAQPTLKPNLVDRFLVSCLQANIFPVIVINKVDLVAQIDFQSMVGVWSQLGHPVLMCSTVTGQGLPRLRRVLTERSSVVAGQSGVGKSSLLNAVQPKLNLRVGSVSQDNQKGKHTTTSAQWISLDSGGSIVDTPGIRQFNFWDVIPQELTGLFRDLRPFSNLCRFPNCSHTHEDDCGIKAGVADGKIDLRRYESYCQMLEGDAFDKRAESIE